MPIHRSNLLASLPVLVVAGMVGVALLGAVAGATGGHPGHPEHGAAVASRDLRFEDRADGAVLIYDAASTTPFEVVQGENGFLRGTLRGLARARRMAGLDDTKPFHLAAWPDGRLTLDDTATGNRVELEAFGHTNEAVFAHLLPELQHRPAGGGA